MSLILQTLKGIRSDQVPVWMMRQAGRYLPEYRELRKNFSSFIDFCLTPEAASEVTLQPLRRFPLDAAIIFSDILIVPHALGMKVDFQEGKGPVLDALKATSQLHYDKSKVLNVYNALQIVKKKMNIEFPDRALIGFAGAPWTVACYMIEGKGSKDFSEARKFCYTNKKEMLNLIEILTETTSDYLIGQIEAGADIIKIFDSWSGLLTPNLFKELVILPTKKIVSNIRKKYQDVPIIGFPKGAGVMYSEYAKETGVSCVAFDQGIKPGWIKNNVHIALQGNLDNALLFGTKEQIKESALEILHELVDRDFIFNLGHGVLPSTPIENVEYLINTVKSYRK